MHVVKRAIAGLVCSVTLGMGAVVATTPTAHALIPDCFALARAARLMLTAAERAYAIGAMDVFAYRMDTYYWYDSLWNENC